MIISSKLWISKTSTNFRKQQAFRENYIALQLHYSVLLAGEPTKWRPTWDHFNCTFCPTRVITHLGNSGKCMTMLMCRPVTRLHWTINITPFCDFYTHSCSWWVKFKFVSAVSNVAFVIWKVGSYDCCWPNWNFIFNLCGLIFDFCFWCLFLI